MNKNLEKELDQVAGGINNQSADFHKSNFHFNKWDKVLNFGDKEEPKNDFS